MTSSVLLKSVFVAPPNCQDFMGLKRPSPHEGFFLWARAAFCEKKNCVQGPGGRADVEGGRGAEQHNIQTCDVGRSCDVVVAVVIL